MSHENALKTILHRLSHNPMHDDELASFIRQTLTDCCPDCGRQDDQLNAEGLCLECNLHSEHMIKEDVTLKPYWCKCDGSDIHKVIFGGDDECPCKVEKHHYHCHACGCIVQIG